MQSKFSRHLIYIDQDIYYTSHLLLALAEVSYSHNVSNYNVRRAQDTLLLCFSVEKSLVHPVV